MIRKAATGKLPGTLTYVLSDNTRDRYGDIIEASGWQLDNFRANPIALFSHQGSFPVGTWANVRVEGGKLIGDYMPADPGTSARIDEINSLVRQNVLKTTSVGFNPIESVPIDPAKPYDGMRYTRAGTARDQHRLGARQPGGSPARAIPQHFRRHHVPRFWRERRFETQGHANRRASRSPIAQIEGDSHDHYGNPNTRQPTD